MSAGCASCYAILEAWKKQHHPNEKVRAAYAGLVEKRPDGSLNWTGKVNFIPERLEIPLRWTQGRRIFVNSMSDLFHESVSDEAIGAIFATMAVTPRHTYQILTKRPERMARWVSSLVGRLDDLLCWHGAPLDVDGLWWQAYGAIPQEDRLRGLPWPLPNVWLGTSIENQAAADERIPHLLATPAAVRFLSMEPLLGPVDLVKLHKLDYSRSYIGEEVYPLDGMRAIPDCDWDAPGIDWVIVGGESGPKARPMHPAWAASLRDQCQAAGVPFFFKQWSGFRPKSQGRLLDDREWNEMPTVGTDPVAAGGAN